MVIKNWCIRRNTKTAKQINNWFKKQYPSRTFKKMSDYQRKFGTRPAFYTYLHYPEFNNKCLHDRILSDYTEITFEMFEKHILNNVRFINDDIETNKIIIK